MYNIYNRFFVTHNANAFVTELNKELAKITKQM